MAAGNLSAVAVMLRSGSRTVVYLVDAIERVGGPTPVEAIMLQEGDTNLVSLADLVAWAKLGGLARVQIYPDKRLVVTDDSSD